MWDYTDKVMQHFKEPKNVGVLKDPDGVGQVGSMACGDALKLMFKLDEKGLIKDAKFQTFGCASAIASSSALTELIKGKSLDEAAKITNQEIADYLGGLPDKKMHCSVLGRDALLAAIEDFQQKKKGQPKPSQETTSPVICNCFGITQAEIERAIQENGLTSLEEVVNFTKAGGGCESCHGDIQNILNQMAGPRDRPKSTKPTEPQKKRLTTIQKLQLIQETLDREIRPALKKDGGDIELVDLEGNTVVVAMQGTCRQCRMSDYTIKDVVEAKLREFVSADLLVVEASDMEDCK